MLRALTFITLLTLLTTAALASFCSDPKLGNSLDGPIVINVTLQPSNVLGDDHLPLFGREEEKNLYVVARLNEVEKGRFKLGKGSLFRLALHSIALSFGYDHAGEEYYVALNPRRGNDYEVLGFSPVLINLITFRAEVLEVKTHLSTTSVVNLSKEPNFFVRLRIGEVDRPVGPFRENANVEIGLYASSDLVKVGEEVCFVLMWRESRKDVPFRVVRLVH